eukprot:COSAG04_NODE_2199_length_4548_cov_1.738368_3_plen_79_part_00
MCVQSRKNGTSEGDGDSAITARTKRGLRNSHSMAHSMSQLSGMPETQSSSLSMSSQQAPLMAAIRPSKSENEQLSPPS